MKNKVIRRIQHLCADRGISIYRLAQLSDIPKNTLNNMMSSDRVPTIPTIERICKGLNITLAQFFNDGELYPELTDSQKEMLVKWEHLTPRNQDLAMKYLELILEYQDEDK